MVMCSINENMKSTFSDPKVALIYERITKLGSAAVAFSGGTDSTLLLAFCVQIGERELVLFPTGRAIVRGTTDMSEARSLYARYIGS